MHFSRSKINVLTYNVRPISDLVWPKQQMNRNLSLAVEWCLDVFKFLYVCAFSYKLMGYTLMHRSQSSDNAMYHRQTVEKLATAHVMAKYGWH